ncbi:MAG: DUF6599 family protein [Planctomycetota bacterium]|jgi:hypothetical protein
MSTKSGQAKPLESSISICLLGVLLLIAVVILLKQHFGKDMSRFGISAAAAEQAVPGQKAEMKNQAHLDFPAPAGFQAPGKTEEYATENLYEKINGKADLYLDSGFRRLFTRRFVNAADSGIWFEVYLYDMASVRNAFSVFSIQRRPDATAANILHPQFAYRTANALYCTNGRYYIEMVGSADSEPLFQAIVEARDNLRKNLAVDMVTEIAELSLFPSENIVPQSFKLYLTDVFGFEGLTDTFAAKYQFDDETVTAFLSRRKSADEAAKVFEQYRKFLSDSGGTESPAADPQTAFVDLYGVLEIVSIKGPFLFGIHEAENRDLAKRVYDMVLNRLSEVTTGDQ